MYARSLRVRAMPAEYQPMFRYSWRALAVYVFLVIWTPIFSMRPLPPFRLDDIWLVFLFLLQLPRATTLSPAVKYFPFWGYLLLAASFALSTATSVATGATLADLYDVFIFIRFAMITWVVGQTHLPPRDVFKLFAAFAFSCLLMYPIVFVQERGIQPWAKWTVDFWSAGDRFRRLFQHAGNAARSIGTIGNPNFAGFFAWANATVCVVLLLGKRSLKRKLVKTVLLANAIVSLPVILLLFKSRSALVCLLVAGAYGVVGGLVVGRKGNVLRGTAIVIVTLGLFAFVAYCSRDVLPRRIAEFLETQSSGVTFYNKSLEPRLRLWDSAVQAVTDSDRILLGFGASRERVVDSGFFYTFYRQGIVGSMFFVTLWIWGTWRSLAGWLWRSREENERFVFLVVGAVLAGSALFELTAEGLVASKTGPILAVLFGVLQRPYWWKPAR